MQIISIILLHKRKDNSYNTNNNSLNDNIIFQLTINHRLKNT